MNNRLTRYEISTNREEIKALKLAIFAFRMEFIRQNKTIDEESITILTDKINTSKDKLWLSLNEIRTLVKIYSQKEFNKTNPFVRNTVDIARKHLPDDIYKLTSGVQRSVNAKNSSVEKSNKINHTDKNKQKNKKTFWSKFKNLFDKLSNFKNS